MREERGGGGRGRDKDKKDGKGERTRRGADSSAAAACASSARRRSTTSTTRTCGCSRRSCPSAARFSRAASPARARCISASCRWRSSAPASWRSSRTSRNRTRSWKSFSENTSTTSGRRGDVVKVAAGYARNYLLPRKLALAVTENNKRQIERERKLAEVRELEERSQAEAFAQRLTQADIAIARRVGENNTLYGSVTSADVAAGAARQGLRDRQAEDHAGRSAQGARRSTRCR